MPPACGAATTVVLGITAASDLLQKVMRTPHEMRTVEIKMLLFILYFVLK